MINLGKKIKSLFINNKEFSYKKSMNFSNNKIIIDGVDITSQFGDAKTFIITVTGDIETLTCSSAEITIAGNVGVASTTSGDISITGDITNSVESTSGDIEIGGSVGSTIKTISGDVECKSIVGSVSTISGNIKTR